MLLTYMFRKIHVHTCLQRSMDIHVHKNSCTYMLFTKIHAHALCLQRFMHMHFAYKDSCTYMLTKIHARTCCLQRFLHVHVYKDSYTKIVHRLDEFNSYILTWDSRTLLNVFCVWYFGTMKEERITHFLFLKCYIIIGYPIIVLFQHYCREKNR